MGNNRNNQPGSIARDLAAAPLATADLAAVATSIPATAMGAALADAMVENAIVEQAETIKPVALPFSLKAFKLNGKAKDYPSDDDKSIISRKVAFAVCRIADSGFTFNASIYRVRHTDVKDPNDANKCKVVTRASMPNSGKMGGFKAIIDTDDAREERALDDFRAHLVTEFKAWQKASAATSSAVTAKGAAHTNEIVDFE